MHARAALFIKELVLRKHPEGGYYRQSYISNIIVNVEGCSGPRNISTAIYYLLAGNEFSAFHRLRSDEVWHHYAGSTLVLYAIGSDGKLSTIKIGRHAIPQAVIRAGTWFAAALDNKKSYCLVGCTMAPGFDYRDWDLGKRDELVKMFPQHKKVIERYTK